MTRVFRIVALLVVLLDFLGEVVSRLEAVVDIQLVLDADSFEARALEEARLVCLELGEAVERLERLESTRLDPFLDDAGESGPEDTCASRSEISVASSILMPSVSRCAE